MWRSIISIGCYVESPLFRTIGRLNNGNAIIRIYENKCVTSFELNDYKTSKELFEASFNLNKYLKVIRSIIPLWKDDIDICSFSHISDNLLLPLLEIITSFQEPEDTEEMLCDFIKTYDDNERLHTIVQFFLTKEIVSIKEIREIAAYRGKDGVVRLLDEKCTL